MTDIGTSRFGRKIKRKKFFGDEDEIAVSRPTAFPTTAGKYKGDQGRRKILAPNNVVQVADPIEEAEQHQVKQYNSNGIETLREDESTPMEDDLLQPAFVGPKSVVVTAAPKNIGSPGKRTTLTLDQDNEANEDKVVITEEVLNRESDGRGVVLADDLVEEIEQHQEDNSNTKALASTLAEDGTISMEGDYLPESADAGPKATVTSAPLKIGCTGIRTTHTPGQDNEANEGKAAIAQEALHRESDGHGIVLAVDPVEEAEQHQDDDDNLNEKEMPGEDGTIPMKVDYLPEPAVVGTHQISNMKTSFLQISNMNIITIALGVLASKKLKSKKKIKKRPAFRVNPYLLDRNIKGRFATDFQDLAITQKMFRENFHMSVDEFEALYSILKPYLLPKRNTRPDDAIHPKQKLAIVLEFLASGDLQRHTSSCYRISKQHFGTIIDLVCNAICDALSATIPNMNTETFLDIANDYNALWNLPNCVGSIDGKHVALKAPPRSGTMFYSYKGYFTLVMLGICDAHYKFTYLDVGAYGSEGDANIFRHSKFGKQVIDDQLEFPEDTSVDGVRLPYFFVGDDAFPLCKRIIKPYTGKKMPDEELVFNYRLSRARRCIENAFGILSSKWLCLKKILYCGPDRAQKIITACCFLHNYLLSSGKGTYCPPSFADRIDKDGNLIEGEWRRNISGLFMNDLPPNLGRGTDYGKFIRDNLKNFVNSPIGSLPWQKRAAFIE